MSRVRVAAPAKVNLTLHVTGRRDDGYHEIDSLVTFAEVGDVVTVERADVTTLDVDGPFADGVPRDDGNLVLRAARLMGVTARITLTKNLPPASGIGGGSADAAATLKGLSDLYDMPLPDHAAAATLGADVPVCLAGGLARMRGIGERVERLGPVPATLPMLLVNPGVAVSTPEVFARLERRDNPAMPEVVPSCDDDAFHPWLAEQRNDLEAPAIAAAPVIAEVLDLLGRQAGVGLARMSGSGATCFALFPDRRDMAAAQLAVRRARPDWWCVAGVG